VDAKRSATFLSLGEDQLPALPAMLKNWISTVAFGVSDLDDSALRQPRASMFSSRPSRPARPLEVW